MQETRLATHMLGVMLAVVTGSVLADGPGQWAESTSHASLQTPQEIAAGEQVYQQCLGCHSPKHHRIGPKHCGLLNRKAGSLVDYQYSQAMLKSGLLWTRANLDAFLRDPLAKIEGTKMGFSGIVDDTKRAQLIRYLSSLSDASDECR